MNDKDMSEWNVSEGLCLKVSKENMSPASDLPFIGSPFAEAQGTEQAWASPRS